MNDKLRAILEFADKHGISLESASIDCWYKTLGPQVTFHHRRETAENMRAVKKAVGGFEQSESEVGSPTLLKDIQFEFGNVTFNYCGAYICEVPDPQPRRNCKPAPFENGEVGVVPSLTGSGD